MKILRNAILLIGLLGILGLLYFNVHVNNIFSIPPRLGPDMHIYPKPNDVDIVDVKGELPNVKFGCRKKVCFF